MGIRVHKAIGYGLELAGTDRTDPRVNWESRLFSYEDDISAGQYWQWLRGKHGGKPARPSLDYVRLLHRKEDRDAIASRDLADCVHVPDEAGLPLLMVAPLGCEGWSRYDDTLDWTEETYGRVPSQGNRVLFLQHGLFPFNGVYMDAQTGERLTGDIALWMRFRTAHEAGTLSEGAVRDLTTALLPGWTMEEALQRVVPDVPAEVRDICEYLELFTDPGTWRELRPATATWWC
jgi:hypothetical protein